MKISIIPHQIFLLSTLAFHTALAQDYRLVNQPLASAELSINAARSEFSASSVSARGNLCDLDGKIENGVFQDQTGCTIHFRWTKDRVKLDVPEQYADACSTYCGYGATVAGDYRAVPVLCSDKGRDAMERRFQAAYRAKRFAQAIQIKQHYWQTCHDMLHITEQIQTRNDLAIAYKNAGNLSACRRELLPIKKLWDDKLFQPSYVYADEFKKLIQAAQFSWRLCTK
ncbi:hypothetical protein ACKLNO_07825 [Neisseriaceae bacterium B1]